MAWRFKGCKKCRGDLMLEDAEWRCLQCGRYYFRRNAEFYEPTWEVRNGLMEQPVRASDDRVAAALAS